MRKIKLLLLMTIVLLCTGCTVEYNINVTEDNIEEIINVDDYITENRTNNDILNHYNQWYPTFVDYITSGETIEIEDYSRKVDDIEYHEKSIQKTSNGYNYMYKYNYDIDDYYDAYTLSNAFIETTVQKNTDSLTFRTKKENLLCQYDYFDSLKVNITIDPKIYKLNTTNTTNINNNTYTWYLDRNNCNDSVILLTLDKINTNQEEIPPTDNPIEENPSNNRYGMYIFYGILILLVLIGYFVFKKIKLKNENFDLDD